MGGGPGWSTGPPRSFTAICSHDRLRANAPRSSREVPRGFPPGRGRSAPGPRGPARRFRPPGSRMRRRRAFRASARAPRGAPSGREAPPPLGHHCRPWRTSVHPAVPRPVGARFSLGSSWRARTEVSKLSQSDHPLTPGRPRRATDAARGVKVEISIMCNAFSPRRRLAGRP